MLAVILKEDPPTNSKDFKYDVRIEQVPTPIAAEGQVLVRLQGCAFNHRDGFIRNGLYPGIQFESIIGADGTGVVVSGSNSSLVDKRVLIFPGIGWESDPRGPEGKYAILGLKPHPGTFAEYIALPQADVVPAPAHLSVVEAAALPLAGLTAWRATFTKAEVKAGHHVLITGIGGGVALTALQFAVAAGANVYVTSSSEDKIRQAIEFGAKGGVNYKDENWAKNLKSHLGSNLLDSIIDGAGGPAMAKYPSLMRVGGIISCYGMTVGPQVTYPMTAVLKNIELRGSTMGSRVEFNNMVHFVEKHRIRPIVSQVWMGFTKEGLDEAFAVMHEGKQFGKLVIDISESLTQKL